VTWRAVALEELDVHVLERAAVTGRLWMRIAGKCRCQRYGGTRLMSAKTALEELDLTSLKSLQVLHVHRCPMLESLDVSRLDPCSTWTRSSLEDLDHGSPPRAPGVTYWPSQLLK
jgi:hypothetical protein